jgi:hypothetical protein
MRYIFFLFALLTIRASAQTTTRNLVWDYFSGYDLIYSGQIKNNKPDGIGLAINKKEGVEIFGVFKNGVLEGNAVRFYSDGEILIEKWNNGIVNGPAIRLSKDGELFWGNRYHVWFEGKILEFDEDNTMYIGEMKGSEFNGRVLDVWADGLHIADNLYEAGKKTGAGRQLEIHGTKGKIISGTWDDDEFVKESTINYPSFLNSDKLILMPMKITTLKIPALPLIRKLEKEGSGILKMDIY